MPGMDGMELQERLHQADPELMVIIMTGYATIETAVQGLKKGAWDYIVKPVDPDELIHLVTKAIEHRGARREVARLRENLQEVFPKTELIGRSPAMKRVAEMVEMVSPADATVLITGESGTGKEVVALAIHADSPRRHMPMVVIHCGALTETLLESELFGHEEGVHRRAVSSQGQIRSRRRRHRVPRRDQRHLAAHAVGSAARPAGERDCPGWRHKADQG